MAYLYISGSTSGSCYCCSGSSACLLTMPFPSGEFADEAAAQDYLDNQTDGCLAGLGATETYGSISASFSLNTYSITTSSSSPAGNNTISALFAVYLKAGSLLTIAWVNTATGTGWDPAFEAVNLTVSKLDGTLVGNLYTDMGSGAGMTGSTYMPFTYAGGPPPAPIFPVPYPIPEDGCYVVTVSYSSGYNVNTASINAAWTITCDDVMTPGGIRAAYDDGGPTSYLVCV